MSDYTDWDYYFRSEVERMKAGVPYHEWHYPPRAELLERLNQRIRGEDPGKPMNWRGLN